MIHSEIEPKNAMVELVYNGRLGAKILAMIRLTFM